TRAVEQGLGQLDLASHAAAEPFDKLVPAVLQAELSEQGIDALVEFGARQAVQVPLVHQVLACRELDVEAGGLEDDAEASPHVLGVADDIAAEHLSRACLRAEHGAENAE